MNDDHYQSNDEARETPRADESNTESNSEPSPNIPDSFEDLKRATRDAFESGAKDAREKIESVVPQAKEEFAKGIHDIAYAFAYATSFGSTLLKEFTPEVILDGFEEGHDAGKKAASDIVEKRAGKNAEPDAPESGPQPEWT